MKQQEAWKEERERGISKMIGLLKFITCGSVDDGKSTLIGHILYDSKLLYTDQEEALELDSKVGSRGGKIDYSLLLDGLMAEREQGITIDVAYRYFTTEKRSFIVADTPGHEEYTRNMAVGASFADLAVILIDASQGVLVQTRRHARICALMGIRHFVFAVNKMDLVKYDQETFRKIEEQIKESEYVLLQLEVNQDANERVVDMANRYGCKVIVNTAPYSKISDEFLSKVYMVTPNEVEAEELTGVHVEDLESAHKAAEYFYKKVWKSDHHTGIQRRVCFHRTVRKRSFRHLKWMRWIRPEQETHSTAVCWRHCRKEKIYGKRFGLQTDWRRSRYKN